MLIYLVFKALDKNTGSSYKEKHTNIRKQKRINHFQKRSIFQNVKDALLVYPFFNHFKPAGNLFHCKV